MTRYRWKTGYVEAEKLTKPMTLNGVTGHPGDWLITNPDKSQMIMSKDDFKASFVRARTKKEALESAKKPAPPATPDRAGNPVVRR